MENHRLQITNYNLRLAKILCVFCVIFGAIFSVEAQSTNQSYPTPVSTNEISGKILARDIGDARLTSYFYAFNGRQGDTFINVVTNNFNGDIDVFTIENLKPLTKITIYADDSGNETGRVIYLRQPAKLVLRIEGRSPNDEAATFSIKFAGSFEPLQAAAETDQNDLPEVKTENAGAVRVNSVGTIIEPKPTPKPKETIAKNEEKRNSEEISPLNNNETNKTEKEYVETATKETAAAKQKEQIAGNENKKEEKSAEERKESTPIIVITDNISKTEKADSSEVNAVKQAESASKNTSESIAKETAKTERKNNSKKAKEPNPLENVRLLILLKDGTKIERQMSDVVRVNVVKGILTVVSKDGSIGRYSILDVAKMTIE